LGGCPVAKRQPKEAAIKAVTIQSCFHMSQFLKDYHHLIFISGIRCAVSISRLEASDLPLCGQTSSTVAALRVIEQISDIINQILIAAGTRWAAVGTANRARLAELGAGQRGSDRQAESKKAHA
jgi:hypothetical protein